MVLICQNKQRISFHDCIIPQQRTQAFRRWRLTRKEMRKTQKTLKTFSIIVLLATYVPLFRGQDLANSGEFALESTLAFYANDEKQIAITFTNNGYLHFALNWLHFVRESGIENYLIFALDDSAYTVLQNQKANVFYDPSVDKVGFR
jgi:hypothetical protein